ncbi:MAG: hypothetical protein AB1Z57_10600 [Acidimicrobiia bacterium]
MRSALLLMVLAVSAFACGDAGVDTSAVPDEVLDPILADAAERTGDDGPTVVVAEAVEWSDASFGCPVADVTYAQVITPGYRVVVGAGGETLDYRSDEAGNFRICEPDA